MHRMSIAPPPLFEPAHKRPAIVPNPLQEGFGGIPGIKEHILRAAAQPITGIAESLQRELVLRGALLRHRRILIRIRNAPFVYASRTIEPEEGAEMSPSPTVHPDPPRPVRPPPLRGSRQTPASSQPRRQTMTSPSGAPSSRYFTPDSSEAIPRRGRSPARLLGQQSARAVAFGASEMLSAPLFRWKGRPRNSLVGVKACSSAVLQDLRPRRE
jgi:hypothetical protein